MSRQSAPLDPGRVYFIEDICRELRVSRSTVERLRARKRFPIPELPSLDNRPRWSAEAVQKFLEGQRELRRVWKRTA